MTTKPKARRFRLRLSNDAAGAPPPSVAPQRVGAGAREGSDATRPTRPENAAGSGAAGNEHARAEAGAGSDAPNSTARNVAAARGDALSATRERASAALRDSGLADEDAPKVRLLRPSERRNPDAANEAPRGTPKDANAQAAGNSAQAGNADPAGRDTPATRRNKPPAERAREREQNKPAPNPAPNAGEGAKAREAAVSDDAATGGARASTTGAAGNAGGKASDSGEKPAPPAKRTDAHGADVAGSARSEAEIEALRKEGLSAQQLRLAMRIAQRQGMKPSSGLEAVRLLRQRGIDPFAQAALLDGMPAGGITGGNGARDNAQSDEGSGQEGTGRALTTTTQPALPRTRRQTPPPATTRDNAGLKTERRDAEIARIQSDIVRRRRRRLALLLARLIVLVILPTLLVGWYFYRVATPLYATNAEFVIQQAEAASSAAPGLGGLFAGTGLATSQDSVTVQSFLQSREAMRRLDAEEGFKAHFQDPMIDPIRRLAPDATDEAAYRLYRRHVQISYDPTEGVVRMEVIAADPETSERFSRALINYAEEQVDRLTQRLRENQMRDAEESFQRAQERSSEAQMRVLELQERFQVLSSEVEVTLLTQQITTLEGQLNQERLSLEDLRANPRPNQARVAQVERRIAALEGQIGALRATLTEGGEGGQSLARVQRELVMAEADVQTRQLLLTQALQQVEMARVEANRQVRYLSMGVSPIAPDESTYPRRFENTALAFLIFAGIYLMISMTISILREQVTS